MRRFHDDGPARRRCNFACYFPGDTREKTFECWADRPDLVRRATCHEYAAELPEEAKKQVCWHKHLRRVMCSTGSRITVSGVCGLNGVEHA